MFRVFNFAKNQKNPIFMMNKINDFLREYEYSFSTQIENQKTGKISLSILGSKLNEGELSRIRCLVIRSQNSKDLEQKVEVLSSNPKVCKEIVMFTQSFSSNTTINMIFFEKGEEYTEVMLDDGQPKTSDEKPGSTESELSDNVDSNEEETFIDEGANGASEDSNVKADKDEESSDEETFTEDDTEK